MRIAIIGGSGLDDRLAAAGLVESPRVVEPQTPFGAPSSAITIGRVRGSGVEVAFLKRHGEGHRIPPHRVPTRANIFALKALGVTHLIATGAVGSLREGIHPGDLVVCDQLIDRTTGAGTRGQERTFFDRAAVHVEFADPCCPVMRAWLNGAGASISRAHGMTVHERGACVVIDGPAFSTRAESEMHQRMGADVVGMTALPEARVAREAEIAYALVALPTDYDCWKHRPAEAATKPESLLAELIGNLDRASDAALRLIGAALGGVGVLETPSPAHDALRLGIWTRRDAIEAEEVERLRPIWGRWFAAGKGESGA